MINALELLTPEASLKPGDEVVSLYDSMHDILPERDSAPGDRFGMGQICQVSGISNGGRIVWLCELDNPGEEFGFHPWLVCPLEQFQSKFPKAVSAILKRNQESRRPPGKVVSPSNHIHFPEIEGVADLKLIVHWNIAFVVNLFNRQEFIEDMVFTPNEENDLASRRDRLILDFSTRQVRSELSDLLCCHPLLSAHTTQARVFWLLQRRSHKLIVFTCHLSPRANILVKMFSLGRTNFVARIIGGLMKDSDFPAFTVAAGRLVHAPVRICDTREPESFLSVLCEAHPYFDYALCDWNLSAEEKAEAFRVTRDSPIKFLCPGR